MEIVREGEIFLLSRIAIGSKRDAYVKGEGQNTWKSVKQRARIWGASGKIVSINDTSWTRISVVDTVAIGEGDSFWVVLSSLHTELVRRTGLFDLVSVGKITP